MICPNGTWNQSAITILDQTVVGVKPYGMHIDQTDTVYVIARTRERLEIRSKHINSNKTISYTLNNSYSIFAADTGQIYVGINISQARIEVYSQNLSQWSILTNISADCYSLFLDITGTLYCSIQNEHKVVKISLNNSGNPIVGVAAGNGTAALAAHTLNYPQGIYVSMNMKLYVADCSNNRIQSFTPGNMNGITEFGAGFSANISLSCPTSIVLDSQGTMYVVDNNNHRILLLNGNQSRCLVGCGTNGSASDQLQYPQSISFDTIGNIIVLDKDNSRVQKFNLICSCEY